VSLSRRGLLAASGLGLLAGCGRTEPDQPATSKGQASKRFRYGDVHASQFADLRLPKGTAKATVVLLHGGYWLPGYGLDLMQPLAERFTELGYATWNVEYRLTGAGGGVPATLSDVATAVDRLAGAGLPAGIDEKVLLLGHSAGGQLAAWAASRTARTPGGKARVPLRGAISLSGVLNLELAATRPASTSQVTAFVGGSPTEVPEKYAVADPTLLVPASCPVWAVQAEDDQVVPGEQSSTYVTRAKAARKPGGATVERVLVPGDHFTLIDPGSAAFPTIRKLVEQSR
jgi:acetyl esterase/lipase